MIKNYKINKKKLEDNFVKITDHDACGVGFIASTNGKSRRDVVTNGINALKAVWHRGAVDADGRTGDGAGLHIEFNKDFFKEEIKETGHELLENQKLCVGMIFLPRSNYGSQERCRSIVEQELLNNNFYIFGWRQVPVNAKVLGQKANDTRPEIEQIIFAFDKKDKNFTNIDTKLFVVRKRIEKKALNEQLNDFYICSLSSKSIIYKGMFLAENISDFYPDLLDDRFTSKFAIFHQRFSTNTFPSWELAQPFRVLAHNGEINTLKGNVNWMKTHEAGFENQLIKNIDDIKPLIKSNNSDTASLDATFELLVRSGRTLPIAKMMVIPEAWSKKSKIIPKAHRDMYNYLNSVIEPWDGPAAIAAYDGKWIIAASDRNGLRPLRYTITKDKLIFAGSETGMVQIDESNILHRGRVGPGQMISLDLEKGKYFDDIKIKDKLSNNNIFKKFANNHIELDKHFKSLKEFNIFEGNELRQRQFLAGLTIEDLEIILHPMVEDQKEAVGSMGDDTPIAVLSSQFRPLSNFFRQNFSQVTNPPIDSLRENRVMSLNTRFGNLENILDDKLTEQKSYLLSSPVLTNSQFKKVFEIFKKELKVIDCTYEVKGKTDLKKEIDRIRFEAENYVREGAKHLVLTDEKVSKNRISIPMILATGSIQSHLTNLGLRKFISLNIKSSECIDTHYFAVLIGAGATTVNPYLAIDSIFQRYSKGLFGKLSFNDCVNRYVVAINNGLLKIMSKMGISVISSYRGGLNFQSLGLSRALVAEYFPGLESRISGIGISGIEKMMLNQHKKTFRENIISLPIGGIYKYRKDGELHGYQAKTIHMLQNAVTKNSYSSYKKYSEEVQSFPPIHLRDLLDFKSKNNPIPIDQVESITEIRKRFGSGSMSMGALSKEAHEALAIAMNRIGGASCSGEGGEDEIRFKTMENGDSANSRVKQVASGRFGVTAKYLNNCNEIEIKIAQGAKPGEGGQLPGFKVSKYISKLRHSTPGVTLVSPPPHHDIYSIEDLAQLIYDLKQINPTARVGVKLVASNGVGTIAAGVAKAKADIILISGHNGGSGATPQTSVKYVGLPWEMGLTETNQILTLNGLRHNVVLRTDGGIKTGRDVVMASMMGADEFGIATTSLIAMGCIMVRQCHSDTCPVGICTQKESLRAKFVGTPEKVVNLFSFIAEEVREILASLGFKSLNEIIGRTDLLAQVSKGSENLDDLDFNPLLVQADPGDNPRYCKEKVRNSVPDTLDERIIKDAGNLIEKGQKVELTYNVKNTDRTIGARLSSLLTTKYGERKLSQDQINITLRGSAGQSLGAFAVSGIKINVIGDCNDYVGKGLSGATLIVRPSKLSNLETNQNTIIGNTVLYGATSGNLFAAGEAGERFAVRNSGANAVTEGVGTNACEYMTGGNVVILGDVGDNFAAGMTGGMAFVFDPKNKIQNIINSKTVVWNKIEINYWENLLKDLITKHQINTKSSFAKSILDNWKENVNYFVQVCPIEMLDKIEHPITRNKINTKAG